MIIDESLTARSYTLASFSRGTFGYPREIKSITIHHWGLLGQTHDGVNNFFVHLANTSAHFVASDGRVNCLVAPEDVAWHAGNAYGNATSVGIECRPEATDGDYRTVAELVRWLREQYGDLPLVPHRDWQATACPGVWDLARLDRMARETSSVTSKSSTPTREIEDDMPLILAKQPGSPDVWIGNVVTRTKIPNDQTLKDKLHLHRKGVFTLYDDGKIQEYDNLDAIGKAE